MDPVTGILVGASLLGGIMQATGGRKQIDPEWLKQHFGPKIVTDEALQYFNEILNSPYGQQALASAVQGGQQLQNETETRAAAAGMGPTGGAQSGSSIFSEAAAGGAANAAARGVRGDLWARSFDAAQQAVNSRMNAWAGLYANQGPTTQQMLGGALGNAAGTGLALKSAQSKESKLPEKSLTEAAQYTPEMPALRPTAASVPSLLQSQVMSVPTNTTPLASAEMSRTGVMTGRLPGRIGRFGGGRSMAAIQPRLG
jgi:hypothetical protein